MAVYVVLGVIWVVIMLFAVILQVSWVPLAFWGPIAIVLAIVAYAWRKRSDVENKMGFLTLLGYVAIPVSIFVLAYFLVKETTPPKVIVFEKTITMYVTDHSSDDAIEAKYVGGEFFRYFVVVLLAMVLAQGLFELAKGWIPVEVTLLVVSTLIAVYLFFPKRGNYDQATVLASNALFWYGAVGPTALSFLLTWLDHFSVSTQEAADTRGPRLGLAAVIILAPITLLLVFQPETLIIGTVTKLVHNTQLSMNQALILLQQGSLFGIFGPGAVRELLNIIRDIAGKVAPEGDPS